MVRPFYERDAPLIQLPDDVRSSRSHCHQRLGIGKTAPCFQGFLEMQFGGVSRTDCGVDPAFREARLRTLGHHVRNQMDRTVVLPGKMKRRAESCHAASDDDRVPVHCITHILV